MEPAGRARLLLDGAVRRCWIAFLFSRRSLPRNATQGSARKEFLVRASPVSRNDSEAGPFFVEFADPPHDLIGESFVIVAVLQDQRLANTLLEPALVIDGIA